MPSKSVTIVIRNNTYILNLPNTGQFIDIQALKAKISEGEYQGLDSGDGTAFYAKTLVDMIATYNVLIPELRNDINVKTISELSLVESRELLDTYVEVYLPWISNWMNIITKPKAVEEKVKSNA